jgi:hypothetical protein
MVLFNTVKYYRIFNIVNVQNYIEIYYDSRSCATKINFQREKISLKSLYSFYSSFFSLNFKIVSMLQSLKSKSLQILNSIQLINQIFFLVLYFVFVLFTRIQKIISDFDLIFSGKFMYIL